MLTRHIQHHRPVRSGHSRRLDTPGVDIETPRERLDRQARLEQFGAESERSSSRPSGIGEHHGRYASLQRRQGDRQPILRGQPPAPSGQWHAYQGHGGADQFASLRGGVQVHTPTLAEPCRESIP